MFITRNKVHATYMLSGAKRYLSLKYFFQYRKQKISLNKIFAH